MMNDFFPELKKITPFEKPMANAKTPNAKKIYNISSSDSASYNRLLEIAHKKIEKERMAKMAKESIANINFPYEISSRS